MYRYLSICYEEIAPGLIKESIDLNLFVQYVLIILCLIGMHLKKYN